MRIDLAGWTREATQGDPRAFFALFFNKDAGSQIDRGFWGGLVPIFSVSVTTGANGANDAGWGAFSVAQYSSASA